MLNKILVSVVYVLFCFVFFLVAVIWRWRLSVPRVIVPRVLMVTHQVVKVFRVTPGSHRRGVGPRRHQVLALVRMGWRGRPIIVLMMWMVVKRGVTFLYLIPASEVWLHGSHESMILVGQRICKKLFFIKKILKIIEKFPSSSLQRKSY